MGTLIKCFWWHMGDKNLVRMGSRETGMEERSKDRVWMTEGEKEKWDSGGRCEVNEADDWESCPGAGQREEGRGSSKGLFGVGARRAQPWTKRECRGHGYEFRRMSQLGGGMGKSLHLPFSQKD